MALGKTTQVANRCGVDLKIYKYNATGTIEEATQPLLTIDFCNEVSWEMTSDAVWATGGQTHANKIGFVNPIEGTLTISTQIITPQIMRLAAGNDISEEATAASYQNNAKVLSPTYYIITGDTLWQDKDGNVYNEKIKAYKAFVVPGGSGTYTGDGEPQSIDIEFQLASNDSGKLFDREMVDPTASAEPEEP